MFLQVETIADQYMVISGAPEETEFHPVHICELALDFIDVAKSLTDPTTNQPIQLRIGITRSHFSKCEQPLRITLFLGRTDLKLVNFKNNSTLRLNIEIDCTNSLISSHKTFRLKRNFYSRKMFTR